MSDVAITRTEQYLNGIAEGESVDIEPVTRKEFFLAKAAGMDVEIPDPVTREEMYLSKISGGSSGGGGSSQLDALIEGSITEVTSNATKVKDYAFYFCSQLTTADFPLATSVGANTFHSCTSLHTANIPLLTNIGLGAFNSCAITEANFPLVNNLGGRCFYDCKGLTAVNFQFLSIIESSTFEGCTKLATADFGSVTSIGSYAFRTCSALTKLILRNESQVCALDNKNALTGTQIRAGTDSGYIYVPAALIEEYKAATNWSNFATQFRALEDYTVDGTTTGELDASKI